MSLSGRTISALKRAGITQPHKRPLDELLRLPGIGVKAVTEIAERYYGRMGAFKDDEPWPELDDMLKPKPPKRCSHRVLLSEHCAKCAADAELRP